MVDPDRIPQASNVRSSLSFRPQWTSSENRYALILLKVNINRLYATQIHDWYLWKKHTQNHFCSSWNQPMRSGSGMESGSCAATSCFKVATLYSPGETSPGIISGKWKVDLGWSISFKDSCHSEEAIAT